MAEPLHVAAFQKFFDATPSRLEATIAFGLFMEAEQLWAEGRSPPPTSQAYKSFHSSYLTDHQIAAYIESARNLLAEFGEDFVLARYNEAAKQGHRKFRWWGVVEAVIGAFAWTAAYYRPEIFGIFKNVSGSH